MQVNIDHVRRVINEYMELELTLQFDILDTKPFDCPICEDVNVGMNILHTDGFMKAKLFKTGHVAVD